eukprot:14735839-Alexandrium_andersonii.AAC.1
MPAGHGERCAALLRKRTRRKCSLPRVVTWGARECEGSDADRYASAAYATFCAACPCAHASEAPWFRNSGKILT